MTQSLTRENAPDLAYCFAPATEQGRSLPVMVFLGGFRSDMQGTKATYLEDQCKTRGQAYLRFDYRGHGQSGGKFEQACISDWAQDTLDIIHHCTSDQPLLLVGSSMGGWISLLVARALNKRVQGLIGLAAAPDFTRWMEDGMDAGQCADMAAQGYFEMPNDYDAPYVITKNLIDDGRQNLLLDKDIDISCPVRLIQGKKDDAVPWQTAEQIKTAITGDDVEIIYLDDADHRLSAPDELAVLDQVTHNLLLGKLNRV